MKIMSELFTEDTGEGGYRLDRLEILNWGGFDRKVWILNPGTRNSLITGANGSGKTTLVDALVTLLVPNRSRHFNQSSGNDRRRDRTEDSYVRGAYGTTRDESSLAPQVRYHRPDRKSAVSVLLAVFTNSRTPEPLCIGQIRWYGASSSRLETSYFLANEQMSIAGDFSSIDPRGEYRKNLKKSRDIEFFNTFKAYAAAFRLRFGMRSQKALTLFNKTVGVKDIDDLNDFIRRQMLDEVETEEEFDKLKSHYADLLQAHNQIELAGERIRLLEDVESAGNLFRENLVRYENARDALDTAQIAVAGMRRILAGKELDELIRNRKMQESRLSDKRSGLEETDSELLETRSAINSNESAGKIRELEFRISELSGRLDRVKSRYEAFGRDAELLGESTPDNPEEFGRIGALLAEKDETLSGTAGKLDDERSELRASHIREKEEIGELQLDIDSLKDRQNNIPRVNLEMRNRIASSLGWEDKRIPFAGELMRMVSGEDAWESAAERLLRPFSLSLLVADEDSSELTSYVNSHNLKGRVVYLRVKENLSLENVYVKKDSNRLFGKIKVRSDSPFSGWIESSLADRYGHICTDSLEQFHHAAMALTSSGLIKSGGIRHEKDDRFQRTDRRQFVMGWDNREKIALLEQDLSQRELRIQEMADRLDSMGEELAKIRALREAVSRMRNIQDFNEIDWYSVEGERSRINGEISKLRSSDRILDSLKEGEKKLLEKKKTLSGELEDCIALIARISDREERANEELQRGMEVLEGNDAEQALVDFRDALGFNPEAGSLAELGRQEYQWRQKLNANLQSCTEALNPARNAMIKVMTQYIRPSAKVLARFPDWESETNELYDDVEYLPEFENLLSRLRDEDLPGYKKRFREYMNRKMMESLVSFSQLLDNADVEIDNYIRDLNRSLKELPYDKVRNTYIELKKEVNSDPVIRDFRTMLKNSHPDKGRLVQDDLEELESAFHRVKNLIQHLDSEESWRKKVLDVRNWSRFSAGEYYRDDGTQKQYYEASGSLSGGEKAKLAYTILASALAYQYGLRKDPVRSFRFIVVDEIFSKVDPQNAEYAMNLFRSLNLQVMVVTPLDNIRLVENYINSVHFVERGSGDISRVHDITIEEVRRHRGDSQVEKQ